MKLITNLSSLEGGRELNVVRSTCLRIWHSNSYLLIFRVEFFSIALEERRTNANCMEIYFNDSTDLASPLIL